MALGFLGKAKGADDASPGKSVLAILEQAVDQRSKLHLSLDASVTGIGDLSASLVSADASGLVLELSGVKGVPASWAGSFMDCFFKIADRGNPLRARYFQFTCRIASSRVKNEIVFLRAALPEKVSPGQRRKSLRVRTELRRFEHIALWLYDPSVPFDVKNPLAAFEHFQRNHAIVENLSAGGMRLTIKYALLKEKGLVPDKNLRLIVHLVLAGASPPMDKPFWIIAKVNNAVSDFATKDFNLGLEFVAQGIQDHEGGKVRWRKVEDNAIEILGQATYLWHVQFYREKGFIDI